MTERSCIPHIRPECSPEFTDVMVYGVAPVRHVRGGSYVTPTVLAELRTLPAGSRRPLSPCGPQRAVSQDHTATADGPPPWWCPGTGPRPHHRHPLAT
jgi:hypothetical protein